MAEILLGKDPDGAPVRLSVERLVETRLLVNANSGAGKSWTLRRLLEQTHSHVQQLVIDPEGEFHTLREKFDYVLAGHRGDCPADVKSAALLARRLLELGVSAILDISELKAGDRVRFVRLFLDAMVNAPRELWRPCLVVVDEVHIFCPETGDAESAGSVIDLMTRGRKRGFCGVLATQRLAKLDKDAAAEANNLLIGRTALDVDLKRASDALGLATREARESLRTLPAGRFHAIGPAFVGDGGVRLVQVGDVTTNHPKSGQGGRPPSPPRDRIKKLLAQLADLPKQADDEARTVADYQVRVRDLERQVRAKPAAAADPAAIEKAVRAANLHAREVFQRETKTTLAAIERGVVEALETEPLPKLKAAVVRAIRGVGALTTPPEAPRASAAAPTPPPPRVPRAPASSSPAVAGSVTAPEKRLLDSLAWLEAIGVDAAELPTFAFLAGYSPTSSGFRNLRGSLRAKELIAYPSDGCTSLTDAGRAIATTPDIERTNEGLQRAVLDKLKAPQRKLLDPLIAAWPAPLTSEQLADAAGYSVESSGFRNLRGSLRALGLVDYPQSGAVRAADILFPEDRRG